MYSSENIQALFNRIGWRNSIADKLDSIVSDENRISLSNRYFEDFSQLITIKRLYDCLEEPLLNDSMFNTKLTELNHSVIYEVLNQVFNYNPNSCKIIDKDNCLANNLDRFDDAIGYLMAIKVIELMLTSHRSNESQRKVNVDEGDLIIELKGFFDDGKFISDGLVQKYEKAVLSTSNCIVGSNGISVYSATDMW